ncbi:hypothetical protein RP20_CCG023047 [Aedes albopictus]|nr:hypothetical protein RP20_CCG023047 [Aedes albopictus]
MDEQRLQDMWQQLQTEKRLSERAFIDCSNALLEWRVKNIRLPRDFEVVLRYKLGQFGMLKDFGEPIQKADESDWRIAVDHIAEIVKQIKLRKIEDMEDQLDNDFFLRLRLAHDKLHCMLDVPELQSIPVREMIYCLAVFLLMYKEERKYGMFKLLLLPVDVVEFLRTVVTSIMIAKSRTGEQAAAFSKVVKKQFHMLRKYCKQVEDLYIMDGTYQDVATVCALDNAIVSEIMLSHITSKLDKLVSSTVCTMEGLKKLSKEMIETHHCAMKNERPDHDLKLFHRKLLNHLPLLKVLLGLDLFLRIMIAYQKFSYRIGQCRTFKQMKLLSSYIYNIVHIDKYQEMLYQNVEQFYLNVNNFEGYEKQHSNKMKALDELKHWLISTTSIRLDQIVHLMEMNINLDMIRNLIHFDLSTISDRINSKLIQMNWSNIDLEENYIHSIEVSLAPLDLLASDNVHSDCESINSSEETEELPSFNNGEKDLLSLNFPDIDDILQTFSRLTTEVAQICKDGLFDKPVSAIKLILVEQKCSTIDEISRNYQNLPQRARIQLQYWMVQILQHLKQSNRLINEVQLLKAGHEMIYGQKFLEFLENNSPSYRAMVSDCDFSTILGALLVTDVLYEDVFNGKPLSLDIRQLKDIQKHGLSWVKMQQDLNTIEENVSEIKLALKSGRYTEAILLSGKQIYSFEEELFGWDSLGCHLNQNNFRSILEKKETFLYVVEKLAIHANVQSLKVLLKSQPQYIPPDSLLIQSIQSGCEDLFHLLVRRKNFVEENVIKMAIAAHMHQDVMLALYEYSDETLLNFLQAAVKANNVQVMKMLITQPFIHRLLPAVLPICIQFNRLKIVQTILNNFKTLHLSPLLLSAAFNKHWAMCRLLVQRGANPHGRVDSPSPYITSCQLAIVGNCTKIAKEWTKQGAEGNRDLGYLTLAASTGSVKMVKVLLKAGFSIIDEHQLYPVVWSNDQDDLKKVLIDCLKPECWTTAVDEIGAWWYRLLEQLKLVPYLTCLTNCEDLEQEDDLLLIVARRLKLYRMVDAHWCIKSCKITQNGGREYCTLPESYTQIQILLKRDSLKLRTFKRLIHVFSLTAMSYAFVEVKSFQEIMNEGLEIFVEEQVFTHSNVLDVIYNVVEKNVLLSCSIRIFNDESEPQRFELLYLEPFKCIVELQISRLQESCELLTIDTLQRISQEHRLLLAVRSGDHTSFIFLLDQIEKVEHEDIWLNPALVHELIDCSHMSTKAKGLVLEKFHAIGIQFGMRHPETGQSAVAYALHKGQLELSDIMMSFICENLTEPQKFIAIIQQCSVDVFKRFLSTRRHSDQEEFNLISNALRELTVKHVYVSTELQTFLWYKLAEYGFANLCTDSDTPKNPRSWMEYVNSIIENVSQLMYRSDCNDFLGIDNEFLFIVRTIHKQLFFIKDKPHLKNIPLREATFLIAVFLSNFSVCETVKSFAVFRMILNKISLMRLLEFVADQLTQFKDFFLSITDYLIEIVPVSFSDRILENLKTKWDKKRENNCSLPYLTHNIWNNLVSKRYSNMTSFKLVYTVLSSEPVIFTPNLSKTDNKRRKQLLKLFHRVKQLYSLRKVLNVLNQMSPNGSSKVVTVASMKRFLQIFGECIKNTPNSQNLPSKLNQILQHQLSGYINFVKQTRDVTCHDYPLAKKLLSLDDQFVYYSGAGAYLRMVKVTIAILMICTYLEYLRSLFGSLRQCRSLDRMRSLIRFVGVQDFVDSDQNDCMDIIIRYHSDLNEELKAFPINSSEEKETLDRLKSNHDRRLHVIKILEDVIQRFLYKFRDIQIAAFSTTSVETIHKFLDVNLLLTNYPGVLDLIEIIWVVLPHEFDKLPNECKMIETSAGYLTILQINFDINQETLQMFHCRDEVRKIVEELYEGKHVEAHEKQHLESDLLSRLDRGGRGYFNNIFMVDSKIQAIKTVFRQQSVKDFAQKLENIRARDVVELQKIFETKQQFIRDVLQKYNCSNIELLIHNAAKIPQEAILAIEYWLMELCEILISAKQFQDNFFALKYDLQMICGKNFRNYLAHDALSYNLLTCSTHEKIIVNALVMAQKQWKLFGGIKLSCESNIMGTYANGTKWLNDQKSLNLSVLDFRHEDAKRVIREGALISGRFWTVKGVFEGLSPVGLAEMTQFTKTNELRTLGANIRKTLTVVDPFVQWDTFSSPAWNMEMALHGGNFNLATSYIGNHSWGQWVKSGWFPQSVYHCLGALLLYLNSLNQYEEMLDILMCFGPDFLRAWLCVASEADETSVSFD